MDPSLVILDGPVGTELARRGVPTPLPLWSATAIETAPDVLAAVHRAHSEAGATVHTANTFRTAPYSLAKAGREADAPQLTARAIAIARGAVFPGHRIAGCLAPLEDCYSPHRSPPPPVAERAHTAMARLLADGGCDLILCETFPHPGEALIAVRAAVATGLPVWLALTPGPTGDLLGDDAIVACARSAIAAGAAAVLVNCGRPARLTTAIGALHSAGVPTGGYGNVGEPCSQQGWRSEGDSAPAAYAEAVAGWIHLGARIVGGCCGTTPEHIAALARLSSEGPPGP